MVLNINQFEYDSLFVMHVTCITICLSHAQNQLPKTENK